MAMRITYKLTAADYIAAQNFHSRRGPIGFLSIGICYFVAPIVGIFLLLSVVNFRQAGVSFSTLSELFLPLLITLAPLWLYLYWRYRFRASRVSEGPCILDFGEDHIESEMPGVSRSTVEWIAVKRYRENRKILLIYLSRSSFYAIPRRALQEEEHPELIALLDRKLKSRKSQQIA